MKILYASETYLPTINGAAIFIDEMAREMARRGHEVSIIANSPGFRTFTQKENGITIYRLRSFPTVLKPSQRMGMFNRARIYNLIKEIRPDVIHIQNHFFIGSSALDAGRRLNIPVIGTNHVGPNDISSFLPLPRFIINIIDNLMWKNLASVFKKCTYLTAPSRFAFDLFSKYGVDLPGEAISNGIDLNLFTPARSGKESPLKKKYRLPDKPMVIYCGRLDPGKEMDVWIRSIPYVLENTNAHFLLVGPGVNRRKLQGLAASLDVEKAITFIDPVSYSEMPDFYRLADLFAISSIMESQGLVVLEAMASGLPVVATNFAALPELVHDGENGFLFEAGDSRVMAEKTVKILRDNELARRMGEKSMKFARKHDIRKTYDSFEALYKKWGNCQA